MRGALSSGLGSVGDSAVIQPSSVFASSSQTSPAPSCSVAPGVTGPAVSSDASAAEPAREQREARASALRRRTSRLAQVGKALEFVRRGDTLVVWKLDRLGRSLPHLIESVRDLQVRKVGFRSLQESLDTTTSGGRLVFHVFGALAEFERDILRERTKAGLDAARARGRKGGRPRVLDEKKTALARTLHQQGTAAAVICATLRISRSSLYRYLGAGPR